MKIHGIHHITAVTANAPENVRFYTETLGLRLVKKTVNQDDTSAYHLFYADKLGSPGTDMTFFDWPRVGRSRHGSDSVARTYFRVNGAAALDYWIERLDSEGIEHGGLETLGDRIAIRFEDHEGQQLGLVDDGGAEIEGEVWDGTTVPAEFAIRGFHAAELAIPDPNLAYGMLSVVLGFSKTEEYEDPATPGGKVTVYSMSGGGPGKEVHVTSNGGPQAHLGAGGVHHIAFRVDDEAELQQWMAHLSQVRVGNSGIVDRFYFKSLYFRISAGILFELATDGPGFAADESVESLGERLSLPPFLEPRRAKIEAGLAPL